MFINMLEPKLNELPIIEIDNIQHTLEVMSFANEPDNFKLKHLVFRVIHLGKPSYDMTFAQAIKITDEAKKYFWSTGMKIVEYKEEIEYNKIFIEIKYYN